jgi:hypothetical protein
VLPERRAALKRRPGSPGNGDTSRASAAAQDAYRMASEALLTRHQLTATGEDGVAQ